MPAVPGAGLVVVEAEFVLGGLEPVLDRPALPLDLTKVPMQVPAGHQVEKKASSPSVMLRRIRSPRVHSPDAVVVLGCVEIGEFAIGPVVEPAPLVPRPPRAAAKRRIEFLAISSAVPATAGLPQDRN